jgi:hypothetical protein
MKFKSLGLAVAAALASLAFASTASATTPENNGVRVTTSSTMHITLESGTSEVISATGGGFANTCTESTTHLSITTWTGPRDAGVDETWIFSSCTEGPVVVDAPGTLEFENIAGTTNATVFSKSAKITSPSPFGALTCTTASAGTDIGAFTGKASGTGTLDINAVLNCGFFLPSAKLEGSHEVTSGPNGFTA